MTLTFSQSGRKLHGYYGKKRYHRRPRSPSCDVVHVRCKEFCEFHGIYRWVCQRAHQVKKLFSGVKKDGTCFYAIYPGCELQFAVYLMKCKKMHKPRNLGELSTIWDFDPA